MVNFYGKSIYRRIVREEMTGPSCQSFGGISGCFVESSGGNLTHLLDRTFRAGAVHGIAGVPGP